MPDTRQSSKARGGKEAKENDAIEDGNAEEARGSGYFEQKHKYLHGIHYPW